MNKIYIIAGIAAIIAVIAVILLATAPTLTLDQILANKDCAALKFWLEENIYDTALTPEQQRGMLNLTLECDFDPLDNLVDQ